ncbi:MAG TPA: GNAT family N-acetyltransferase [Ilumatobacteraceae bacterium]|nr:GNAT family N-acetyltransferase [Ilumatobacteraceae bacterium]
MALLVNGARKLESELGASVKWSDRSATLAIPAFQQNGDPRALQIAALSPSHDGFFEELAAQAPLFPHVALLFADDERADPRAIHLGYVLAETTPLMTASLANRTPGVPALVVEPAEVADINDLVALDPRSGVYRFDDYSSQLLVARLDGRIVGKAQLVVAIAGIGYLTDMVVDASYRRRGIGRALVTTAESHARTDGCDVMLLASTEMGRTLFSSLGYETICWLHSYVRG